MLIMFAFAALAATTLKADPADRHSHREIVYVVESKSAPTSNSAYSFREDRGLVAGYIVGSTRADSLNPKVWHPYKRQTQNGVIHTNFHNMSIPVNANAVSKWSSGANVCRSSPVGNQLLVTCARSDDPSHIVSAYVYAIGKGITGFFAPCYGELTCWYQLRSHVGILANSQFNYGDSALFP